MEHIVVAIDGCEHSKKVVEEGVKLARLMSAKIFLVHVIPRLEVPEELLEFATVERIDEPPQLLYTRAVAENLLASFAAVIKDAGVEYENVVLVGDAAEQVVEHAKTVEASYIVIGIMGLHGVRRIAAALGSTSRKIIENAPCNVVVVPR